MTTFVALFLTIPISFALSTALVVATSGHLRTMLEAGCEEAEGVRYWVTFSTIMIYVVPLLTGLVAGVGSIPESGVHPATGATRIITSLLGGCFIALTGIGLQLAKHNRNLRHFKRTGAGRIQ